MPTEYTNQWIAIIDGNEAIGPFPSADDACDALSNDWYANHTLLIMRLRKPF